MMTRLKNSLPAKPLQCQLRAVQALLAGLGRACTSCIMAPVKYVGSNKQSTKNTARHSRTLGGDSRTRLSLVPSLA